MTSPTLSPRLKWALLSIAIAALLLFLLLPRHKGLFRAVPAQTALVLEFDGLLKAKLTCEKSADPDWKPFFQTLLFRQCFADVDAAAKLFQHDAGTLRAFAQNTALAAFSLNPADSLFALFAVELEERLDLEKLLSGNKVTAKYFPHQFHGNQIFNVHLSKNEQLEVAVQGRTLLFSRRATLVEDAISCLEKARNWWADRPFASDLPKTPLRAHLSPAALSEQWRNLMSPRWRGLPDMLANNIKWAGAAWDGRIKRTLLETKGFWGGLAAWGDEAATNLPDLLPENTAFALWFGLKNTPEFSQGFGEGRNADFDQYVLPWMGELMAIAFLEPLSPELASDRLLLLAVRDSAKAARSLRAFAKDRGSLPIYSGKYHMFEIWAFQRASLLSPLLSDDAFRNPVCALVGDYAVFAPDRSSLEMLIDKYLVSKTLGANTDFLQMNADTNKRGTLGLLLNTAYVQSLAQGCFKQGELPFSNFFGKNKFVAAQIAPGFGNKAEAWWQTQKLTSPIAQTDVLWKAPLQVHVATRPFWLGESVLAQDIQNQLYCLQASNGVLHWSKQLPERIISNINRADFYNNGKLGLAFNTQKQIYALDEDGRDLIGFPLQLPAAATCAATIVDFDNTKRFNYFVACENGHLYGWDHLGKTLHGWNAVPSQGRVSRPLLHFQHKGKDYLAVLTDGGLLSVFGRDGALRFPPVELPVSTEGAFGQLYADTGSTNPRIYVSHSDGSIFACNLQGKLEWQNMGESTSAAVFGQLSGDEGLGWAYWQGKTLFVGKWNTKGSKKLFSTSFAQKQHEVFFLPGARIGTVDKRERRIWMFDTKGRVQPGFPIGGSTVFEIGSLNGVQVLTVGNAAGVWAYRIR